MKKTMISSACTTALICAGTLVAAQDRSMPSRQSQEVQQETKTTTPTGTTKMKTEMIHGKVESYEPGKSMKVTVPGKAMSTKSFSLNDKGWSYNVPSDLKPGQWVTVSEKTDNNGHKMLTVQHSSQKSQGTASRSMQTPHR
jgi:hypothetical protein